MLLDVLEEMKRIPTDFDLLSEIHLRYYEEFRSSPEDPEDFRTDAYVPISIKDLANHFGEDAGIIFGRLYYHLDKKFGYSRDDGFKVPFFISERLDKHSVQFPLLIAILADMREERRKHAWSFRFSVIAIILSGSSILLTGLKFLHDESAKPPASKAPISAPPTPTLTTPPP